MDKPARQELAQRTMGRFSNSMSPNSRREVDQGSCMPSATLLDHAFTPYTFFSVTCSGLIFSTVIILQLARGLEVLSNQVNIYPKSGRSRRTHSRVEIFILSTEYNTKQRTMSHSMSDMASDSMSSMSMTMMFTNSHTTPLYANSWTPSSEGGYAGTCIFLVLLAMMLRLLFAAKAICEQRWLMNAQKRRYVLVRGRTTEAGRIDQDPDAKTGSLVTANGVEENVKVVQAKAGAVVPFRLSVDVPRACLTTVIAGVSYLLMLAVMTMNVGYFLSVLAGVFVGELMVGRYAQIDEHLH